MPAHGECSQGLGTYSTVPVRTIIVLSLSYTGTFACDWRKVILLTKEGALSH